ncbi:MAG: aminodeoxychorismate/anthranilate synthase component II [Desulfobulbaceae bacterium]|jgi:anthranilate synthase/aminodeoxychorismate synthase-like glutamine amidotransferase|nr:aminodeoxychorismate/anthranilate synthase component II [Desulfobulbaceae bacterium]HKJ14474.1 aminodeoxychorismate/anthranilate synthase component II [Desulfobulbales bacterium]MDH3542858.1 aminodeoxychorismate/anthranilate synthase component II [Desulfobulbaceae bacterium]MDH3922662.1 aminodeoxychorismate/anthranilate synthase component II [Desulfobulbaceae bacterium]MDH3996682.1 aminodeoxychorismate/anthranilate synthase component II [Desulfobulbaceae bacterium]
MIVIIDNYDSFTYNIVQTIGGMGAEVRVFRNDTVDISFIEGLKPDRLLISPGPCTPTKAGISIEAIRYFAGKIPILGVCLGHQSIGEAFGGDTIRASRLMHGKTSPISHDGKGVFTNLPNPFEAMRYHSLVVSAATLPECLEITAKSDQGELMGLRHRELPIEGVQFHPESIMTPDGVQLLKNFLDFNYTDLLR